MPDQLSLELPADLPAAPRGLRPMLPRPARAPFDSPDHLFQPLWDGLRALVFVARPVAEAAAPAVTIVDVDGVERTTDFPELAAVADGLDARSAVLDGEIVVVDRAGRLDRRGLAARLDGRGGPPALFLAFDLVHLDGRSLLGRPLERRREVLRRIVDRARGGPLIVVPAIEGDGRALHAAVEAQGLAGVLARVRTSPYLPGVRSRLWRFVAAGVTGGSRAASPADEDVETAGLEPSRRGSAPVLAVIARLPLGEP